MNSAPIRTVLALVLVAPLLTAGCAARWAYRQGQSASEMGDWDLAVNPPPSVGGPLWYC